jgi:hypothetical protein
VKSAESYVKRLESAIVGYRSWRMLDGLLFSMYRDHIWIPSCAMQSVVVPSRYNSSGVYAYSQPVDFPKGKHVVSGRVALWGRVVICERGYRAQYAYPLELWFTRASEDRVRDIAGFYRCDVREVEVAMPRWVRTLWRWLGRP